MPSPDPDPIDRPSLVTRRALLALAGSASAVFAIPAAIALSRDNDNNNQDYDYGDDDDDDKDDDHDDRDHDDDDRDDDHDDYKDDGHDDDDDDGKVDPEGTVPAGSMEVRIVDDDADAFKPGTITIDLGQSVTFVNLDDDPHTATGRGFDTGNIDPGEQATVTFDEPGVFPYACDYHPMMTGTVSVRDEDGQVPGATPSASPAASPNSTGATVEVTILDFAFDPAEIEIEAGTAVAWTNDDGAPHTATAEDGSFDTGALQTGDTAEHTFDTPGTFPYICAFHPSMTGTIVVT